MFLQNEAFLRNRDGGRDNKSHEAKRVNGSNHEDFACDIREYVVYPAVKNKLSGFEEMK